MSEGWGGLGDEEGRGVLTAQSKVGLSFSQLNIRLSCSWVTKDQGPLKSVEPALPAICGGIGPHPTLGGAFSCFSLF